MFIIIAALLGAVVIFFWDWIYINIVIIGSLTTAFAFLATAWTAYESRKSAKASFRAVKIAENSLAESRDNFKKDSFNQRFSLLLQQHNIHLEKVNEFSKTNNGYDFFNKIFNNENHMDAFCSLRGHFIFSPYMRVLYHLLKFINEDFYGEHHDIIGRKKYSSVVRSLIGNDVLFLIAINASFINYGEEYKQYEKYQYLLHLFDFFEHADFYDIIIYGDKLKNLEGTPEQDYFRRDIKMNIRLFNTHRNYDYIKSYKPTLSISDIISYIYDSPTHENLTEWFKNKEDNIKKIIIKPNKDLFNHYFNCILDCKVYMGQTDCEWVLTRELLKAIIRGVRNKKLEINSLGDFRFIKLNTFGQEQSRYLFETIANYINSYLADMAMSYYDKTKVGTLVINTIVENFNEVEIKIKDQKLQM